MEQPNMAGLRREPVPEKFDMLEVQRDLQGAIKQAHRYPYEPDIPALTEHEMLLSLRFNEEAISSEFEEIRDRLPWKLWRTTHRERIENCRALSDDERMEIMYELIDIQHFINNLYVTVGFTSWTEVEEMYWAKNKENHDRVDRGY